MKRSLRCFLALWFMAVLGCSGGNVADDNIAIAVVPSEAIIVPGSGSSCVDKATAASSGEAVEKSIASYRLPFSNFLLQWRHPTDTVNVVVIRVTIQGSNIKDGSYTATISDDEVGALLGDVDQTLSYGEYESAQKAGSSAFPNCGLQIGDIPLVDEKKPFNARVTIELIGVGEDSQGNQYPVRQKATASAKYY